MFYLKFFDLRIAIILSSVVPVFVVGIVGISVIVIAGGSVAGVWFLSIFKIESLKKKSNLGDKMIIILILYPLGGKR